MRVGYIILCRYNSSRLPGKILKPIIGKPLLAYIYERLCCIANRDNIVVATSREASDLPIVSYCKEQGIQVFLGSLQNVAERFVECAEYYNFDYAARINGDNLFVSPRIINQMLPQVMKAEYDFLTNVKNRTYPRGMSVEFVRTTSFRQVMKLFSDERHFEHVTLYLYENEDAGKRYYKYNTEVPEAQGVNLAIDTFEDFELAKWLLSRVQEEHCRYDLVDWIELLKEYSSSTR